MEGQRPKTKSKAKGLRQKTQKRWSEFCGDWVGHFVLAEKMCFSVQSPTVNNVSVLAIRASVLLPNFSSNYGFTCRMKFEKVVFLGGRKYRALGVFAQVFRMNWQTSMIVAVCWPICGTATSVNLERFVRSLKKFIATIKWRLNAIYSRLMGNEARLLAPGGFVANVLIFR